MRLEGAITVEGLEVSIKEAEDRFDELVAQVEEGQLEVDTVCRLPKSPAPAGQSPDPGWFRVYHYD
ncbi:MAG: hypothetical protein M3Q07_03565 [Pseudobdellovibrionaceae bacterium]|nr:hypothetical protein [Pseudobdellovibrionaceae bacterium]